jgi:inositol transport system substrate-binding protein
MKRNETKTVSILLTVYSDPVSRIIQRITASQYSHAAIGMENNRFFTFGFKKGTKIGFRTEKPWLFAKIKQKTEACVLYKLEVTEETYGKIEKRLQDFNTNRGEYTYSFLGALLCFLKIPHNFKKQYFCSRFVAELLSESGALELKKSPSLYQPADFTKESQLALWFQGELAELANVI